MKKKYSTSNVISINFIFLISIIISLFFTYIIPMIMFNYFPIDVNEKISTLICLVIFLPIIVINSLLIRFENKKQIIQGILPVPLVLSIYAILSTYTNWFDIDKFFINPFDFYRGAFFHPIDDYSIEYWKSVLIPHLLIIIINTIAFSCIPFIKYIKSNKNTR